MTRLAVRRGGLWKTENGFAFGETKHRRMKRELSKVSTTEVALVKSARSESIASAARVTGSGKLFSRWNRVLAALHAILAPVLLGWEVLSTILKEGLAAMKWWKRYLPNHIPPRMLESWLTPESKSLVAMLPYID
jgi:hypothetical protein